MVQRKDYDLIFMDQFMPGIDGIETTKKIREMGGKYNSMPIIALTANAVPGARDMMLFMGMSDYVSKPIDHNALNRVLVRWLPHSKISSSLGRFSNQEKDEHLDELPRELVEIAELNCSAALKKIDGSAPIYIELMHQFTEETGNYIESLSEYLEKQDLENYRIVINGVKSLLYNIGAKACGDMASELEKAAAEKNEKFCNEKNDAFAESLKWLSQRVALALPATLSEP
jgi:CheY-like chemotaxis protein